LHRAIDLFGDSVGVVDGDRVFSYAEFGERCQRLASALQQWGIQPGDRVAYLSFNTHQLLEGYFGVIQARAIILPLNVRLAVAELVHILNHSGSRVLIFQSEFGPLVEQILPQCPGLEACIATEGKVAPATFEYEEFIAAGRPERADITQIDENAVAELFYTSGSTGTPKGVMLTHRNLYLHSLSLYTVYQRVEDMVVLHTIPLFHANGWGHPQTATYFGVKQVMVRRFVPATVFELIERHRATDMYLVPAMAQMLLQAPERTQYDLSSMRRIMIGGAAASPELIEAVEKAFGCECYAGYGLTETGPILTAAIPKRDVVHGSDQERYRRQAMTGWPLIGNEIRVVDEQMRDVPRDGKTIGEIVVRGDHVMAGYYNAPELTAETIVDGWLKTGDMAVWDRYGYIQIVDRKKEIIISGGENIASLEIEQAILAHPAVLECAVVAAPDERWGEVPYAYVVRKPEREVTAEELREFLSGRLAKFKIPKFFDIRLEPLPKTGTGKIRKLELRQALWQNR